MTNKENDSSAGSKAMYIIPQKQLQPVLEVEAIIPIIGVPTAKAVSGQKESRITREQGRAQQERDQTSKWDESKNTVVRLTRKRYHPQHFRLYR